VKVSERFLSLIAPQAFSIYIAFKIVFEDIYITLYKVDGEHSAVGLRKRVAGRVSRGSALQNFHDDYGDLGLKPSGSMEPEQEVRG